jgi:hypothetical protein
MQFFRIIFYSIAILFCWWISTRMFYPELNVILKVRRCDNVERAAFLLFLLLALFSAAFACYSSYMGFSKNKSIWDLIPAIIAVAFLISFLF